MPRQRIPLSAVRLQWGQSTLAADASVCCPSFSSCTALCVVSAVGWFKIRWMLRRSWRPVEVHGVTGIGFGTWSWGNQLLWGYEPERDDPELAETLQVGVRGGLTLVDTADSYGTGRPAQDPQVRREGALPAMAHNALCSSATGRDGDDLTSGRRSRQRHDQNHDDPAAMGTEPAWWPR